MNIVFLTGLPRSGSTLFCSILAQNPDIHTGRLSNLCDLMWNAQYGLNNYAGISGKPADNHNYIISKLPDLYYEGNNKKVIIDQCRGWTLPPNFDLITKYINTNPKILCLTRDIDDVRKSYENLFLENERNDFSGSGYELELMRNVSAVEYAKTLPQEFVHFINYNELVLNTLDVLKNVYSFIGEKVFNHDLENIVCNFEDDESHGGLLGLHTVRNTIGFRTN